MLYMTESAQQAFASIESESRDKIFPFKCVIRHIPLKRVFDILFSASVLLFLSPLYLLIALLIKTNSKGKVFYNQKRIGRGGKPFNCYKFRTMYSDADERLNMILCEDRARKTEWELKHKLTDDPRITPIGIFLRKTSLDELPQFWNVIRGDLSVVGPRPVVQEEINKHFGVKAYKILSIRPGITGLWQVSGRNDISYEERVKLDEDYIDKHSMLLDMKLILKTLPVMLVRKGAY